MGAATMIERGRWNCRHQIFPSPSLDRQVQAGKVHVQLLEAFFLRLHLPHSPSSGSSARAARAEESNDANKAVYVLPGERVYGAQDGK